MLVRDLMDFKHFQLLTNQDGINKKVEGIVACDLLSHVMGFAGEKNILITVLNNMNVLGVASLLDFGCVIFSHDMNIKSEIIDKANELNIPVFKTKLTTSQTVISLRELGVKN